MLCVVTRKPYKVELILYVCKGKLRGFVKIKIKVDFELLSSAK
jgi:hypothetical protein